MGHVDWRAENKDEKGPIEKVRQLTEGDVRHLIGGKDVKDESVWSAGDLRDQVEILWRSRVRI